MGHAPCLPTVQGALHVGLCGWRPPEMPHPFEVAGGKREGCETPPGRVICMPNGQTYREMRGSYICTSFSCMLHAASRQSFSKCSMGSMWRAGREYSRTERMWLDREAHAGLFCSSQAFLNMIKHFCRFMPAGLGNIGTSSLWPHRSSLHHRPLTGPSHMKVHAAPRNHALISFPRSSTHCDPRRVWR